LNELYVTSNERQYLRDLAKEQLDYSGLPIMKEREKRWYSHNDLKGNIPMIHFETRLCEQDLLPVFKCKSDAAKRIELQLFREILNHKMVDDDRVVPSFFKIGWDIRMMAKLCGLLSYGCCEPVHPCWRDYICKLPGLRKVSVSPWCNEEYIGEALRGTRIIYHRKPSPNFIGVGKELDETAFRQHILKTIKCAKGCKLEFSFRDVYTLEGNAQKPRQAVHIIRELLEDNW